MGLSSAQIRQRLREEYGDALPDEYLYDQPPPKRNKAPATMISRYTRVQYPSAQRLRFDRNDQWDDSRLVAGIKNLTFGHDFEIDESHLYAIASNPDFCNSLRALKCGDSDTGNGSSVTDAPIIKLASVCPQLVHVDLESFTDVTDRGLLALVNYCPELQCIGVTGNDKVKGHVNGSVLDDLRNHPCLGKHLKQLYLTDQGPYSQPFERRVKKLLKVRKGLAIQAGETGRWAISESGTRFGGKSEKDENDPFGADPFEFGGHLFGFDDPLDYEQL